MKRSLYILIIVVFLLPVLVVPVPAGAAGEEPGDFSFVFLPFISGGPPTFSVSGSVQDDMATPLPDVTIIDINGVQTTTDENGAYELQLPEGENMLFALKAGYAFTPEELSFEVTGDLSGQNFTAALGCGDIMVNGTLDYDMGGWDFPIADAWDYSSARTTTERFYSTPRSARTGIMPAMLPKPVGFDGSNSYGVSQVYQIPSDADSAYLGMWIWRRSTSGVGEADRQYIRLIDEDNLNVKADLHWGIADVPAWTYVEFPLNTFIGQRFRVQVGTINDTGGGIAAMYYDNVSLVVCKSAPIPPVCTNYVVNSGFEVAGSWIGMADLGQDYPPIYSPIVAVSGLRSARTGIVNPAANVESFSEFYQNVAIPSGATNVKLSFYLYPVSTEVVSSPSPAPAVGEVWAPLAPVYDTQYAYLLDPVTDEVLMKLVWWQAKNYPDWIYHEFDVSEFAGETVKILFGSYNNGPPGAGVTAMYVDDVFLGVCPDGTPTPPAGCYEAFENNSFETNGSWTIPSTVYPAGYSTLKVYDGSRSMRSGIFYESHNKYSYSDFYQKAAIGSIATSAELTFWVWQKSLEPSASSRTAIDRSTLPLGINVSQLPFSTSDTDLQYLLALDKYGNILDWVWTDLSNDKEWTKVTLNVKSLKGQTIRWQWGVYNNGDWADNITVMFVDSASLIICEP